MDTGLRDQRILVTGASGGIGAATARALAAEGAHVALHFLRGAEAADRLRDELHEQHAVQAPPLQADLRNELEVDRMFEYAIAALGRLDGIVVNAGVWPPEHVSIGRMTLAQWNDTVAVNLTGAFLCCRAFVRHLEQVPRDEAAIVLVGSTAGIFGEPGHGDYAATKAGLRGLMLSLKNEIVHTAPRGRVNLVSPGWTATPMAEPSLRDEALVARVTATMPLRKVATPEDVAVAIAFLLSPRSAGHISGVELPVAGGMEGRLLRDPASGAT
ncbi:MAG TPA: SDR family NAD(P)-dependent oxidoreductase [Thermoanaerobaculia bacterium]|nr:SDR family NAD(P)-dependent oxidoreductase [Thermoanaerobaculia bacterium]